MSKLKLSNRRSEGFRRFTKDNPSPPAVRRGLAGPVAQLLAKGLREPLALASDLNIDLATNASFCGSKDEEGYGKLRLQPLSYVVDINRASKDMNSMRAGNITFSSIAADNFPTSLLFSGTPMLAALKRACVSQFDDASM